MLANNVNNQVYCIGKWIKGYVSKETVVVRRWKSIAGNLVLTTRLEIIAFE